MKRAPPPPSKRYRWLDQWPLPAGTALQDIATGVRDRLEGHEAATKARKRARRAADQDAFHELVDITTANLALAVLDPPATGALAVRAGKLAEARTRYDHPAFGKQFRPLMDRLEETGFATLDVSRRQREVSALRPTAKLADLVRASGVTLQDFGRHPEEECIRVTRKIGRADGDTRHRADYRDTDASNAMRVELRRLNAFLAAADIDFVPDGLTPEVSTRNRSLSRHFLADRDGVARFDQGGRLFGGWWMNLPSGWRHGIRIGGEPVADLDYSSMFVRLAYAHLGKTPPNGDLYTLPGLEGYRDGVKLAINTLFWDRHRGRKKWPKEMGVGRGDDSAAKMDLRGMAVFERLLPVGWDNVARLTAAIRARHPDLQPAFGRAHGGTLMFRESEIMVAVLGRLMGMGVVALPLHDGLMVSRSHAAHAKTLMVEIAEGMTGAMFPVSEKSIPLPQAA